MKHIQLLIKPASSLCNLRCSYCFYADISSLRQVRSFGRMKPEVTTKLIDHVFQDLEDGDHLTIGFQGGEPTLAGLKYFQNFVKQVKAQPKQVTVDYAIQTNGLLLDEAWCQFLKTEAFLVGLSIDGGAEFHDRHRPDGARRGTYQRVLATKKRLDDFEIPYNVLCVLTEEMTTEAEKIWSFILQEQIKYIQFIPCLAELGEEENAFAVTPRGFAQFYRQLFDLWQKALRKGHYVSIKLFDDIANLLVNGVMGACGMLGRCQMQYVIEANGNVYPCDFYVLDELCVGNITQQTLRELFEQPLTQQFICDQPHYGTCDTCEFFKMCRGGCKRMKEACYVTSDTDDFCGYREVLQEVAAPLVALASSPVGR